MTTKHLAANILVVFAAANLCGQTPAINPVAKEALSKTSARRPSYYINPLSLHLDLILSPPSARDSGITAAELKELHRIEAARTAEQVAQAKADDQEEDIFPFKSVLGPGFTAEALPITASLSTHIRKDESAAGNPLKNIYWRPRPYQLDTTLLPACALNPEPTSYPSGYSLSGYLLAFTLVQLVPEKRQQILDRADEYVHNRLVCGVHYASDIEASRRIA